jgi:hypothetical protein
MLIMTASGDALQQLAQEHQGDRQLANATKVRQKVEG